MSTAIATITPAPIQQIAFSQEQVDLIKSSIAKGATDSELSLFMNICQRTGLDPFVKQIYCIERRFRDGDQWKRKMEPQVSIDGLRLVAERTGKYQGQVGPFWCGTDGQWRDVWISKEPPSAAKVGVIKTGCREPFWGVALFDEYAQKASNGSLTKFWASMPSNMLAKCAESLALRKAFPAELSGIYTREESTIADEWDDAPRAAITQTANAQESQAALMATKETIDAIQSIALDINADLSKALKYLKASSLADLTQEQAAKLLSQLEAKKAAIEASPVISGEVVEALTGEPDNLLCWQCTKETGATALARNYELVVARAQKTFGLSDEQIIEELSRECGGVTDPAELSATQINEFITFLTAYIDSASKNKKGGAQ